MKTNGYEIILASGSPRRKEFFEQMGIPFTQKVLPVSEIFPEGLKAEAIAEYLVKLKATPFEASIQENQLVITADTIVWHKNKCLGKPENTEEATKIGDYWFLDSNCVLGHFHRITVYFVLLRY